MNFEEQIGSFKKETKTITEKNGRVVGGKVTGVETQIIKKTDSVRVPGSNAEQANDTSLKPNQEELEREAKRLEAEANEKRWYQAAEATEALNEKFSAEKGPSTAEIIPVLESLTKAEIAELKSTGKWEGPKGFLTNLAKKSKGMLLGLAMLMGGNATVRASSVETIIPGKATATETSPDMQHHKNQENLIKEATAETGKAGPNEYFFINEKVTHVSETVPMDYAKRFEIPETIDTVAVEKVAQLIFDAIQKQLAEYYADVPAGKKASGTVVIKLDVGGSFDRRGNLKKNQDLAQRRADLILEAIKKRINAMPLEGDMAIRIDGAIHGVEKTGKGSLAEQRQGLVDADISIEASPFEFETPAPVPVPEEVPPTPPEPTPPLPEPDQRKVEHKVERNDIAYDHIKEDRYVIKKTDEPLPPDDGYTIHFSRIIVKEVPYEHEWQADKENERDVEPGPRPKSVPPEPGIVPRPPEFIIPEPPDHPPSVSSREAMSGQASRELGPMKTERIIDEKDRAPFVPKGKRNTGRGRVELDEQGDAVPLDAQQDPARARARRGGDRSDTAKQLSAARKRIRQSK